MALHAVQKKKLIEDARGLAHTVWSAEGYGFCLYTCLSLLALAYIKHRVKLVPQAGTASWRFKAEDDGVSPIQFTYEWQGIEAPEVQRAIREGRLPEMHVWLADVEAQEVIDPVTCDLPAQLRRTNVGQEWTALQPPDFIWSKLRNLPAGTFYSAEKDASVWVGRLMGPEGLPGRELRDALGIAKAFREARHGSPG